MEEAGPPGRPGKLLGVLKYWLSQSATGKKGSGLSDAAWKAKVRKDRGLPTATDAGPEEQSTPSRHVAWVWDAFTFLSRARLVNDSGPQPITVEAIRAYTDLMTIDDPDDKVDLMFFLQAMDIEWCRVTHDRISKAREKAAEERKRKTK